MRIKCLGGFREVGKNSVLLEHENEKILLDYGVKVETNEVPLRPPDDINAMLIAHAHLDHSGMAPAHFQNGRCPVFSTVSTFDQAHMLLKDSIKVSRLKGVKERFNERDLEAMMKNEKRITYGQEFEVGNARVDVIDAGHVPGSCMFLLKTGKKNILFTSDFKIDQTNLLSGARLETIRDRVDVAIMESTYGLKEQPKRSSTEEELFSTIKSTIESGGMALLPCFAVGRAAEILMVLDKYKSSFRVFLDGMAKEATEIALRYPEFLRDPALLKKALEDVVPLYSNDDRKMAISKPSVIITTAGMMSGGPIVHYLKELYNKEESAIIFTGFQAPKTPGRYLMDTHSYKENGLNLKVKMQIKYLSFSAHAGRSEILQFIKKTNPEKIICMHGDECEKFALDINTRLGIEALAPANGDVVELD